MTTTTTTWAAGSAVFSPSVFMDNFIVDRNWPTDQFATPFLLQSSRVGIVFPVCV